jgi:light-regulated signal transduction histidine kinase (bacteriophytochrome)
MIGINTDITDRKNIEQRTLSLNLLLESRVADRTLELTNANKELESFSYSVSHDLRAPLRTIDGFGQALLEDCGDKLDDNGKSHLQRIRAATQRMGLLIDDLLNLSRVTRAQLGKQTFDLSAVVSSVAHELQATQPQRKIAWNIQPGISATGDSRLLRVALENLVGNAWKFTSHRPAASIEFGKTNDRGDSAFFIKDDGAGFDPVFADRLFGAFQRLHAPADFPGTGVGLATVQRIIHRHGGRVWAESAPDRGATFYFTLPQNGHQEASA